MTFHSVARTGREALRPGRGAAGAAVWMLVMSMASAGCAVSQSGAPSRDTRAVAAEAKLSAEFRARGEARGTEVLSVLIRTRGPVGDAERADLRAAGVEVLAVAGEVVSGRVVGRRLGKVAALPFVVYVEPGRRLLPERER